MNVIKEADWASVEGYFYIRTFIHADKTESHSRNRNAIRKWLPENGDPQNPPVNLKHYTRNPSGKKREKKAYHPMILADVQKFKENLGYISSVAPDESQTIVKKPKSISDLWALYKKQDLEKRVSLKTFQNKLEEDTIQSHQNIFNRYVELFSDHKLTDFPKNLENKFRELAPTLPKLNIPTETLSPITVRSIGGHRNRFFEWCSLEELIPGRPKKLKLPGKKLKTVRTAIPTLEQRNSVESRIRAEVAK